MFKGNKIFIKQAKSIGINNWILRSKYPSEGKPQLNAIKINSVVCANIYSILKRLPVTFIFHDAGLKELCLDQSPFKCHFNSTHVPKYLAVEELPLPSNIEDLASSEKLKFSPHRSREINGSYIKYSTSPMTKFKETVAKTEEDERIQCYDCSGTINLSSAMQTNVPFPFTSRGKPTHLNMPGGQWAQNQKYTSEDLNNIHHFNFKNSVANGGTCSLGVKNTGKNSFLSFPVMDLRRCDCLQFSFNCFINQNRNFSSQKEKVENVDKHNDKKVETKNVPEMSRKDKLKAAVRDYGAVIMVFHIGISLISLGCCYCLIVSGVDLSSIFKDWGVEEGAATAGTAAQFIVAYAVHKSLAPARIAFTLSAAPFVVTKLRKIGLLKPLKPKVH